MENISENRAGRYRKTLSGEFAYESLWSSLFKDS